MTDKAYGDDAPTEDELKILNEHLDQTDPASLPPADDAEGDDAVARAEAEAGATAEKKAAPPAKDTTQPPATAEPDAAQVDFLKKHEGKTPEELASLLWQQQKRANGAETRARITSQQLGQIRDRARQTLDARRTDIEKRRAELDAELAEDPDATVKRLANDRLDAELLAAENDERRVRVDTAIDFAAAAIPNFTQRHAGTAYAFGLELNYTPAELNGIEDGRDLVTLHLASIAGRMLMAGIIDPEGNFVGATKALETEQPTDPRLRAPDPLTTLGSGPARSGGGAKTALQTMQDALGLSDADFDKLTDDDIHKITQGA